MVPGLARAKDDSCLSCLISPSSSSHAFIIRSVASNTPVHFDCPKTIFSYDLAYLNDWTILIETSCSWSFFCRGCCHGSGPLVGASLQSCTRMKHDQPRPGAIGPHWSHLLGVPMIRPGACSANLLPRFTESSPWGLVGDVAQARASCEAFVRPSDLRSFEVILSEKASSLLEIDHEDGRHARSRLETESSALVHHDLTIDGQVTARLSVSKPGYHH